METVGFIGLGNMGMGMGGNIQKADYPMVVFDIRDSAMQPFVKNGARAAGSPAEVARLSDVVFTSLPGPKEVEEVATGASGVLEGIKPGGIYVDLSTSRPTISNASRGSATRSAASSVKPPEKTESARKSRRSSSSSSA